MPTNRKTFELIILGCSGGPISGKTCSFLLKPTDTKDIDLIQDNSVAKDAFLAIDAGTGMSSILSILDSNVSDKLSFLKSSFLLELYPKTYGDINDVRDSVLQFIDTTNLDIRLPFQDIHNVENDDVEVLDDGITTDKVNIVEKKELSNYQIADILLNSINSYLITHSHLDHVSSLVINSPAFTKQKSVYGIPYTIDSIKKNLFNDEIWPDLVSNNIVSLHKMTPDVTNNDISNRYPITAFEVSHGTKCNGEIYLSTAFLINDLVHDYNILFFGDVESDASSKLNKNIIIWNKVAPLIIQDKLNSIIIECSTIDIPPPLFGHLTPLNLIDECLSLRKQCIDATGQSNSDRSHTHSFYKNYPIQPLDGLNMIIIHVKETLDDINPRRLILDKLLELNKQHNLKIHFSIGLSGISLLL